MSQAWANVSSLGGEFSQIWRNSVVFRVVMEMEYDQTTHWNFKTHNMETHNMMVFLIILLVKHRFLVCKYHPLA